MLVDLTMSISNEKTMSAFPNDTKRLLILSTWKYVISRTYLGTEISRVETAPCCDFLIVLPRPAQEHLEPVSPLSSWLPVVSAQVLFHPGDLPGLCSPLLISDSPLSPPRT